MTSTYHLLLIDITGIQGYLFSTNKLQENVGASELVKNIYEEILKTSLNSVSNSNKNLDNWKLKPNELQILQQEIHCEIGYIGGGNALLIFKSNKDVEEFKKNWSRTLLIKAPGISTSFASIEVNSLEGDEFKNKYIKMFEILRENKLQYSTNFLIPDHGITATCSRSGNTQDTPHEDVDGFKYVSSVVKSKLNGYQKSYEKVSSKVKNIFQKEMNVYHDFEKLQEDGNSHIAIVHIDGNGIGQIFQNRSSLLQIRNLSLLLKSIFCQSFDELLDTIKNNLDGILKTIGAKDQSILPIRPMVIGGDDITFICPGKLGFYFTEVYLEKLLSIAAKELNPNWDNSFSACAGIAITKIGYPFYKGYELAEAVCLNAKEVRKEKNEDGSWIDFHIQYGSLVGKLKQIRNQYKVPLGNLLARPYQFSLNDNNYEYTYFDLKSNSILLSQLANNKIHRFRDVLYQNKSHLDSFIREMEGKEENWDISKLKKVNSIFNSKNPDDDAKTYFFDMIEFIEFYPKSLYENK